MINQYSTQDDITEWTYAKLRGRRGEPPYNDSMSFGALSFALTFEVQRNEDQCDPYIRTALKTLRNQGRITSRPGTGGHPRYYTLPITASPNKPSHK